MAMAAHKALPSRRLTAIWREAVNEVAPEGSVQCRGARNGDMQSHLDDGPSVASPGHPPK